MLHEFGHHSIYSWSFQEHISIFHAHFTLATHWNVKYCMSYLEQLNANASKHELQQGGDNHDISNGADCNKHTLYHVLFGKGGTWGEEETVENTLFSPYDIIRKTKTGRGKERGPTTSQLTCTHIWRKGWTQFCILGQISPAQCLLAALGRISNFAWPYLESTQIGNIAQEPASILQISPHLQPLGSVDRSERT